MGVSVSVSTWISVHGFTSVLCVTPGYSADLKTVVLSFALHMWWRKKRATPRNEHIIFLCTLLHI